MNEIYKIAITAFCTVLILSFLKNAKAEYSYFVCLGSGIIILSMILPKILILVNQIIGILNLSAESVTAVNIFFKCVIICEICSLAKEFCRDSSNSFIAMCVDLAEKTAILIISMPLINSVIKIILKFIGT